MIPSIRQSKRLVIKIGAPLITDEKKGTVRDAWLAALASDVADLHRTGKEICLVSSGAIALGSRVVRPRKLEEKQAAASIGQITLAGAYANAFNRLNLVTAQVLMTRDDTQDIREMRMRNAQATFGQLFTFGAIPVVNENDTVGTAEIRAGDNDALAVEIADMIGADLVIQLMNAGDDYTPEAAAIAREAGIPVLIAPGNPVHALRDLLEERIPVRLLNGDLSQKAIRPAPPTLQA